MKHNVCKVIAAILALLCATALLSADSPGPMPPPADIQVHGWVAPTFWDHLPPLVRNRYLLIDQWVFAEEQTHGMPSPTVIAAINYVMALEGPGVDRPKKTVSGYLHDTIRIDYMPTLVNTLDPGITDISTRRVVLVTVDHAWKSTRRKSLRAPILTALQNYQNSNLETDTYTLSMLSRVIQNVQN